MHTHHIRPVPGRVEGPLAPAPTFRSLRLDYEPYTMERGALADAQDALTLTREALAFSPMRSHRRRGVALSLLLAVGFSLLAGCETAPEEVRALEARSIEAIANYDANAVAAVDALLAAYREASRREAALVVAGDVRAAERDVTYTDPEGQIQTVRAVAAAEVIALLEGYRDALDRVDASAAEFRAGWDEARGDYVEAMALREELYRWLSREGIQPEHIDAIGRALADAIERRGR